MPGFPGVCFHATEPSLRVVSIFRNIFVEPAWAIVGCEDDEGIFVHVRPFKGCEHLADLRIHHHDEIAINANLTFTQKFL